MKRIVSALSALAVLAALVIATSTSQRAQEESVGTPRSTVTNLGTLGGSALAAQEQEGTGRQVHYSVINLGTLGGVVGAAFGINNKGWVTGDDDLLGDQTEHGFLWRKGVKTDLGTFGGPNSSAPGFQNDNGVIVGSAQTPELDPLGENFFLAYFCGNNPCDGIDHISLPFRWQDGVMTALPTLGGYQGQAYAVNNQGQVVGGLFGHLREYILPGCGIYFRLRSPHALAKQQGRLVGD